MLLKLDKKSAIDNIDSIDNY